MEGVADAAPARHAADIGSAARGEEMASKGLPPPLAPPAPVPAAPPSPQPVVHVMPASQPKAVEVQATPSAAGNEASPLPAAPKALRRARSGPASRCVADPFDADDDSANCIRCGYAIESAREQRGMMTCAKCA
jgi:hypothetical protein